MKNVLIAVDSFKNSMTSLEVAETIKAELQANFNCETVELADGGEGTQQIITKALNGQFIEVSSYDPLMRPIRAKFGLSSDQNIAIVDVASSSGIELLENNEKDVLKASSYGTGVLIKEALNYSISELIIGLGSSSTNDLGFGILQALGVKFLDSQNEEIQICGNTLKEIVKIDTSELDPRLENVQIKLACDVTNPLTGENGSCKMFAKQKGASEETIQSLEQQFIRLNQLMITTQKTDLNQLAGSGAAGGIAGGLSNYLGAEISSGSDLINDINNIEQKIKSADLVITGEGRFDLQSLHGKGPMSIIELAQKHKKQVIVICGSVDHEVYHAPALENIAIYPTILTVDTLENTLANAKHGIKAVARNIRITLK